MINRKLKAFFISILVALTVAVPVIMTGCDTTPATTIHTTAGETTSAPSAGEAVELDMILNPTGFTPPVTVYIEPWMQEVEQISGGRVKIRILDGVVTGPGLYDSLVLGIGDVAFNMVQYNPGRFPCLEIMTIPDIGVTCARPAMVASEMYKQLPEIQQEFSEVKVLAIWATAPSPPGIGFGTSKKPVYTLEDFRGLKIGTYGGWAMKAANAVGCEAVSVEPQQTYESVQRGIVDGTFMAPTMLELENLKEVVKYYNSVSFLFPPFYLVMNWDSWNRLPSDIQKILEEIAASIPEQADIAHDAAAQKIIDAAVAQNGLTVINFSPEETARWQRCAKPVQDEYLAKLAGKGIDGQKILDTMRKLMAQYATW